MTTLYNHKPIGTNEKPIIPNKEFKKLCDFIRKGNKDVSAWTDKWTLEKTQNNIVKGLLNG